MWLLAFFGFVLVVVIVIAIVEQTIDKLLGVHQALAHLSRWKVYLHETMYIYIGIAIYVFYGVFLK